MLQILAPRGRGLRIGRIGKVSRIIDAGAVLLDLDLAFQLGGNPIELGDHRLDLRHLAALLVDLKFLQADEGFT
jgi:hypothetical protein